jgi:Adenylate and Guanylate cyclase catalytic domain
MTLHLYPSDAMKDAYSSYNGIIFALAALLIFAFTSIVFYLYDAKVESRQAKVMKSAVRTSAIVSSLFPSGVRDRLYPSAEPSEMDQSRPLVSKKIKRFVRQEDATMAPLDQSMPIADLYPETTVLFGDIVGFTAWSSVRSPTQVFHLLETLYASFDDIAKKRRVFKVETIGDSYVAIVGLPTARQHHAVVMARFASDCRDKMREVAAELENTLGPVSNRIVSCVCRFNYQNSPSSLQREPRIYQCGLALTRGRQPEVFSAERRHGSKSSVM